MVIDLLKSLFMNILVIYLRYRYKLPFNVLYYFGNFLLLSRIIRVISHKSTQMTSTYREIRVDEIRIINKIYPKNPVLKCRG